MLHQYRVIHRDITGTLSFLPSFTLYCLEKNPLQILKNKGVDTPPRIIEVVEGLLLQDPTARWCMSRCTQHLLPPLRPTSFSLFVPPRARGLLVEVMDLLNQRVMIEQKILIIPSGHRVANANEGTFLCRNSANDSTPTSFCQLLND